jgi:integrase/recombinase XerD
MKKIVKRNSSVKKATPLASQVVAEYEVWLIKRYGKVGSYLTTAKTFLRRSKEGAELTSQLETYMEDMSLTMQSILRRFGRFLAEKGINFAVNDLLEKKLPLGNIYVKIFLASRRDRLRGEHSLSVYATVLNQFFNVINDDLRVFNKRSAEKFIHAPGLSDFTKRLYKSVLRSFCDWALLYQNIASKDLSQEQRQVQKGLRLLSAQSLREIVSIKVLHSRAQAKRYHKESLSVKQRNKLLNLCEHPMERAVISLMAWNGLRTIEVLRLIVPDVRFREKKLSVWGKGKSNRSKEQIWLLEVPLAEVKKYFKENSIVFWLSRHKG